MNALGEERYDQMDAFLKNNCDCSLINFNKINIFKNLSFGNYLTFFIISALLFIVSYQLFNNFESYYTKSLTIIIILVISYIFTFVIKQITFKIHHDKYKKYIDLFFDKLPREMIYPCTLTLKDSKRETLEYSFSMDLYLNEYITRFKLQKNILNRPPYSPMINMAGKNSNMDFYINTTKGVEKHTIDEFTLTENLIIWSH